MEAEGHPITPVSKNRTAEEQAALYAKGRTKPGSVVTEKTGKPGDESKHQTGDAVDFAFLKDGQPSYGEKHPWDLLGTKAKEVGLEWGGDWTSLVDRPHVQQPLRAEFTKGSPVQAYIDPASVKVTNAAGVPVAPARRTIAAPMGGGTAEAAVPVRAPIKAVAKDPLDDLPDGDPLDALPPSKLPPPKEPGLARKAIGAFVSPIDAVSKAAQGLANKVDIAERPVTDAHQMTAPGSGRGWAHLAGDLINPMKEGNLLTAPFEAMYAIEQAALGAAKPAMESPVAALRGGTAGAIEGAGNITPMDIAQLLLPMVARGRARLSPSSRVLSEKLPPPKTAPRVSVAPSEGVPDQWRGARLVREKVDPATQTVEYKLAQAIKAGMSEAEAKRAMRNDLPPADLPPRKPIQGRARPGDATQPEPARNIGSVEASGRKGASTAADALRRAGHAVEDTGDMPPMKKTKLPVKERPARPEAELAPKKIEDLDENSTIREVADAVNAVARREPEVLAPRNPRLEQLAADMEARAKGPNKAANEALVAETLKGATGEIAHSTAARRRASDFSPEAQRERMLELAKDPNAVAGAKNLMRRKGDIDANRKLSPPREVPAEPVAPKVEAPTAAVAPEPVATEPVVAKETPGKVGGHGADYATMLKVDDALENYTNKGQIKQLAIDDAAEIDALAVDMKANGFNANRPVLTKPNTAGDSMVVDGYHRLLAAKKAGIKEIPAREWKRGDDTAKYGPGEPKATPLPSNATSMAEHKRDASLRNTQDTLDAAKVLLKKTADTEVPVTKVPSATSKAPVRESVNLEALSPAEKVRFTKITQGMPESLRTAVHEGKPFPKGLPMAQIDKATVYRDLYKKATGAGKVEAASAPVRPPAPARHLQIATKPSGRASLIHEGKEYTPEQVHTFIDDAGKKLEPKLRKAIDEHSDWPEMTKEQWDKTAQDVLDYTGWRDKIRDFEGTVARNKEIDSLAQSNLAAAAKAEGTTPPKASSVVARSEAVAKKLSVPKPDKIPVASPKAIAKAVDEVLKNKPATGSNIDRMYELRRGQSGVKVNPYLTETDIGPAPKGTSSQMWRTVNANAAEGARLYKERGYLDPRIVDTMRRYWGSEETARRLGVERKLVEEISGKPHRQRPLQETLREMEDDLQKRVDFLMDDPKGFIRLETLIAGTGAAAGGLVGASLGGESVEDRMASAISLAILGGLAGTGAVRSVYKRKQIAGKIKSTVEELDTANLLAGPAAVKASLGSVGGVSAGIWQRFQEGRVSDAKRGIRFMTREAPGMWARVFKEQIVKGPNSPHVKMANLNANAQQVSKGISGQVLTRVLSPFSASDVTGKAALKRMGFSEAESLRMMMNGEPTTPQGQAVLKVINSMWITRMLAKFPRVRIGSIERGIEFTPGLSGKYSTRTARGAEQLTKAQLRARAQFGGAALVAGTAYGYYQDPGPMEGGIASSIAGPAFLPAAAGIAFGKGLRKGGVMRGALDAAIEVGDATPQIADTNIRTTLSGERFKPGRPLRRALGGK